MAIKNMNDLANAYDFLIFLEGLNKDDMTECASALIAERKRTIREFTHRTTDRRVINENNGGSVMLRIDVPEDVQTQEEAEEWFDAEERMEMIPGPYDCTGRPFTYYYHIGRLAGKLVCWHGIAYDV